MRADVHMISNDEGLATMHQIATQYAAAAIYRALRE